MYLLLAYRFSEVLPNCSSFEPHKTTKTVGGAAGKGLHFPSEEQKRWSLVWPLESLSSHGHLSPVTHPLQAILGMKPAGQSYLFRKPYLAVSWGPGLTLPSAAQHLGTAKTKKAALEPLSPCLEAQLAGVPR